MARSSRLRRRRGYVWEDTLSKRLRHLPDWSAFRLGSASTSLPDILAVSSINDTILAIEAKSGSKTNLSVPPLQIQRCLDWCAAFDRYGTRHALLAFRFISKKHIGTDRYRHRDAREYYKVWDDTVEPVECICTYDGQTYALRDGVRHPLELADYPMPFL